MRRITLLFLDIALLYTSLVAMLFIRYPQRFAAQYNIHLIPFGIIFTLWLIIFFIANLYNPRTFRNTLRFYSDYFQAIAIAVIISVIFFYLIPAFGIAPKDNLLIFIIIFTGLDTAARAIFNGLIEKRFKKPIILIGSGDQVHEVAELIQAHPQLGYELSEIIAPQNIERLNHIFSHGRVDTIVISPEAYQVPEIIDIFYKALARKINFLNLSSFYERVSGRVPLGAINQIWFLENLSEGSKQAFEKIKRFGDIVFGFIFGILSLVFYPFVILAIKLSSGGPIFYKQTRIGQMGQTFEIIKFRTMVHNAEATTGAVWAGDNDPRVTRVGRFLRKSRLDEIPQLWNILRGEMSLVGPRAERPEFHEQLKREVPFYEERYLIKPGLTGWAQINFHYGSSIKDAAEKLQYDLYYIKNRSIVLDISVILKTIGIALQQSGR